MRGVTLPTPTYAVFEGDTLDALQEQVDALTPGLDFLVVDTPGRDDEFAKYMAARANTLVTPMNDSFVDFDLIGQVDPENFKVRTLSFRSEEHTSELPSLMRISYAVFCLKQK